MTCHYCQKTALYCVGQTGYCKTHRENAITLRKSIMRKSEAKNVVFDEIIDEAERRKRAVRRMRASNIAVRKRR